MAQEQSRATHEQSGVSASHVAPRGRHSLAVPVYLVIGLAVVLCAEVAGMTYWAIQQQQASINALKAHQTDLYDRAKAAQRAAERPPLVPFESLKNNCHAINSTTTCHITNTTAEPVAVCLQGIIVQKVAAGVRLYSLPVCSGPIGPRSTREVSAPWDGGNADDICKGDRGYLDWSRCEFNVINFDPNKK